MSWVDQALTFVGVVLPKEVFIQNHRLGLVLIILRLTIIGVWLSLYAGERSHWYDLDVPTGGTTMRYLTFPRYAADSRAELQEAEWCDPIQNTKYAYEDNLNYSYTNFVCQRLPENERWLKGETELYIPTMFEQRFVDTKSVDLPSSGPGMGSCEDACADAGPCPDLGPGTTGNAVYAQDETVPENLRGQCVCRCEAQQDIFATGVAGMVLQFHHQARSAMDPPANAAPGSRWIFANSKSREGPQQVLTIIRDSQGNEKARFAPGEIVSVSLGELLGDWGGQRAEGENYLDLDFDQPELAEEEVPLRVQGVDVEIVLNYNYPDRRIDMDIPVCNVEARLTPKWLSRLSTVYEIPENVDGRARYRFRYHYGIVIHFTVTGQYTLISPMLILSMLADLIVYLQIPSVIIMIVSRYSLGQLSNIYYKAQVQILDIGKECYGLISRALVAKQTYDAFVATQESDHGVVGLASGKVREQGLHPKSVKTHLRELLGTFDDLDDKEITVVQRVLLSGLDPNFVGRVTRQRFVEMCTNDDETNLTDLANIFNQDRKRCFFESVFDTAKHERDRMGGTTSWDDRCTSPRASEEDQPLASSPPPPSGTLRSL